ncbi:MAG: hypothetical protein JSV61_12805 [Anaerolineales bacterium]|nr:MAG: hypothetical protein JSV61_12805 [Anaerolineales bacterium]
MDEKTEVNQEESFIESTSANIEVIQGTLNNFLEAADVTAVYGEPIKNGDTLIIPTAEVLSGMGFGLAYGGGEDQAGDAAGGAGGGGGGRILSRPVAVVIATPDEVRVEPVVDITKISLAALTASGFMMGMLLRMMRGWKDTKGN